MISSALLFFLLFSNLEQSGSHISILDRKLIAQLREGEISKNSDTVSPYFEGKEFDDPIPSSISSFDQSIWFGQYANLLESPFNQYAHVFLLIDRLIKLDKIETQEHKNRILEILKNKLPEDFFLYLSPFIEGVNVINNGKKVDETSIKAKGLVPINLDRSLFDARGENIPNEGVKQLFEEHLRTKWLDFSNSQSRKSYASIHFESPKKVSAYELTSANDCSERDPRDWTLWGKSKENVQWHAIDVQKNIRFENRHQSLRFLLADESEDFTDIKLEIHSVNNISTANSVQLSRLRFFGGSADVEVKKSIFGLKESSFFHQLPKKSVNFFWDVSLYDKLTSNPKKKLKDSPRHFIFDDNFDLASIKLMIKYSKNDWSIEKEIEHVLEEGAIPEHMVEIEILPYFINLCENIWGYRYRDKLDNLRVINRDGSDEPFFRKISSANKQNEIHRYFAEVALNSNDRFELLKSILNGDKEQISLFDAINIAIDHKDNTVPLILNDENQKKLKDFFNRMKRPEEIAVLSAFFFHLPQKDLVSYLENSIRDKEVISDLLLCIKRMPSLDKKNLQWLFSRINKDELLSYHDLSLKSELLEKGISADLLNKYNTRYPDGKKDTFSNIIFEYISRSGDLERDPMHELYNFAQENSRFKLPLQMLQGMSVPPIDQRSIELFADSINQKILGGEFHQDAVSSIIDGLLSQVDLSRDMESLAKIFEYQLGSLLPLQDVQKIEWLDQELTGGVDIAGIDLPFTHDIFDERLIPDETQSDLIMTPTANKVLRKIAGHWLSKSPAILEGSTSAGKTSYVQYVAGKTRTPMIRVNLSKSTGVQDLLGRWVAGYEQYSLEELRAYSSGQLSIIAKCLGTSLKSENSVEQMVQEIFKWQQKPHFQAGPVLIAMFTGSTIVLDEINLASNAVIEGVLNSLLDSKTVTVDDHKGELVVAHADTRVFATMNPASYIGRNKLSDALKSRCTVLKVDTPNIEDIVQILSEKYPGILDVPELQQLVSAHSELAKIAEQGAIGRDLGRISYTLRNLFRVVNRFQHFKDSTNLSRMELLRREFEEVYKSPIFNSQEKMIIEDALMLNMPIDDDNDFYENLDFKIYPEEFVIGDIKVARKTVSQHDQTSLPEDLNIIMTQRTKKIFYQLVKALELGENVALVGEKASGKTMLAKYYSALKGQPFFRETFSPDTDNLKLIGKYTPNGFQYGPLIEAGHPEHEAGIYLADEINLAPDAIQERLNSLLDSGRSLTLTEGNGDLIRFHQDFRFVAAMNPPTRKYGGRKKMSQALQNRLTVIFVESLENEEEFLEIFSAIGESKGIPKNIVQTLVSLHFWVKQQIEDGNIGTTGPKDSYVFSIRKIEMAFGALVDLSVMKKDIQQAFKLVAEIYYESMFEGEEDRQIVREFAQESCQ
ncbi:MAG: AAA family ATPase [Oligoflexales bacterium]